MNHRFALHIVAVGACVSIIACRPTVAPQLNAFVLRQPLEGACPTEEVAGEWQQDTLSEFAVTVSGPAVGDELLQAKGTTPLRLEGVPAEEGKPVTIALFGLQGGAATWRGVAPSVQVSTDGDTPVDIALAKIGEFSCARQAATDGLAMHTATILNDGTILLVGGARTIAAVGALSRYTASDAAYLYRPSTGAIETIGGRLNEARMFHAAALLPDGRVLIAGGAAAVVANGQGGGFPFAAENGQLVGLYELYDPATQTFSSVLGPEPSPAGPRIFATATTLPDGRVLIAGGSSSVFRQGQIETLSSARNDTTLCSGSPLSCGAGPVMTARRAGHVAALVTPPSGNPVIYLVGGNVDGSAFEMMVPDEGSFRSADVSNVDDARNVFFPSSAVYIGYRLVVAGGLRRSAAGAFSLATVEVDGETRGPVWILDPTGCSGGTGNRDGCLVFGRPPMAMGAPSFLGSAAALQDELRVLLMGGYSSLQLELSSSVDIFRESESIGAPVDPQVRRLEGPGGVRNLREPRAGLTATAMVDGTVVIVGGEVPQSAQRASARSAEVFAESTSPPGVRNPQ